MNQPPCLRTPTRSTLHAKRPWTYLLFVCAFLAACASGAPSKLLAPSSAVVATPHASAASAVSPPTVPEFANRGPCRPPPPPGDGRQRDKLLPPDFGREKLKLEKAHDTNGDGRLDRNERDRARLALESLRRSNIPRGAFPAPPPGADHMPKGPFGELGDPLPGPRLALEAIETLPATTSLYAPATLRTLWLEFAQDDWEDELAAFHDTDVEVPAKLTVDGISYREVGVRFRGMSSFAMVPTGFKRSLAISIDAFVPKQSLLGARSLNLLNSAHDPTFLRSVLALEVARHYLPAPHANHIRVVINGESWGVYVNTQQVNKDFIQQWFGTTEGHWWKVPGSPNGQGNLGYLGNDRKRYEKIYELKSKDSPDAYRGLIELCRVIAQSKPEDLEQALSPLLDIDEALRYLALENLIVNSDGYFVRTSDYYLYQATDGRFSLIPHDVNETFNALEAGPGTSNAPGVEVDPLLAAEDARKPLISRLLSVPRLRAKYFAYLREMADNWLDWSRLEPTIESHRRVIASEVARDTKKLSTSQEFESGFLQNSSHAGPCGSRTSYGLKPFVEARRRYLLSYPGIAAAARPEASSTP